MEQPNAISRIAAAWMVTVAALALSINLLVVGLELQVVIEAKVAGSPYAATVRQGFQTARQLIGH